MENKMNQQQGRQPNASAQDATSYEQDSARNPSASASSQSQPQNQAGRQSQQQQQASSQNDLLNNITGGLSNVQIPQAVKDFGSSCARSFNSLSTTQKVIGGAAIALGASYWAASSQGWIGQNKSASKNRSKNSGTQHS